GDFLHALPQQRRAAQDAAPVRDDDLGALYEQPDTQDRLGRRTEPEPPRAHGGRSPAFPIAPRYRDAGQRRLESASHTTTCALGERGLLPWIECETEPLAEHLEGLANRSGRRGVDDHRGVS